MSDTRTMPSDQDVRDIIEKDRKHLWHHLFQHSVFETQDPQVFVEGEGARVRDIHGNWYLDGASGGVWCVNVGYGRESIAKAVYEQLRRLPYYAGVAGTVPAAQYASALAQWLPELDRLYFANSGSEA
ncbi:MAG: aminotransferase class III-fold pyridoxal phosphate-dependent enzyme, partial [Gemmatimonadota bacterium]|nr:aminotransferase class III-fold pyridoxal phosphate-dependent enzyme [Gemmatimonadota bacterium]